MSDRPVALVGRTVTVRAGADEPAYFTDVHRRYARQRGRVHAIVPSGDRDDPLVKVGFDDGARIVFYRLADLVVDRDEPPVNELRHGKRGSHLPSGGTIEDGA